MQNKHFIRPWILANTTAMFIAYLLYTPIAHGITGSHGHELNTSQLIMHCIALAIVALIIFYFQRKILSNYIEISSIRIFISIILFILFFWWGYYTNILPDGPDYDILFGYLVLGSGLWLGKFNIRNQPLLQLLALLSFPIGSFIGELILFITVTTLDLKMNVQEGMLDHTIFWLVVGVTTGIVGGLLGGWVLSQIIGNNKPVYRSL